MKVFYHEDQLSQEFNVFYDPRAKRLVRLPKLSKRNGHWRGRLADLYTKQIDEEGIATWDIVSTLGWDLYEKDLRATGGRYRGFEQRDGVVIAISILGRRELPDTFEGRVELVDHWLAWMPWRTRIKGPRDFGGEYAGSRPGGSGDSGYVKLDVELKEAKEVMTVDGVDWQPWEEDQVYIHRVKKGTVDRYIKDKFVKN